MNLKSFKEKSFLWLSELFLDWSQAFAKWASPARPRQTTLVLPEAALIADYFNSKKGARCFICGQESRNFREYRTGLVVCAVCLVERNLNKGN